MKKQYDEIMDKIEVTEQMRSRILHNVYQSDIFPEPEGKVIRLSGLKKYLSAAACFAILSIGALALHNLLPGVKPGGDDPIVMVPGSGIETVSSLDELSTAVGFAVDEIKNMPFVADEITYTSYWQTMAQITYSGEGQSLTFRKSAGTEDNSGNYTAYADRLQIACGKINIELKGEDGLYYLAVWQNDGYSYSISCAGGLDASDFAAMASGIVF